MAETLSMGIIIPNANGQELISSTGVQELRTVGSTANTAIESRLEGVTTAYDVAVANGFTGTVQEWLDSLVGAQGIEGPIGPDGPANMLAIGTVEDGTTAAATITGDAPSQVLNLTLPKGDTGATGPAGADGATSTWDTLEGRPASTDTATAGAIVQRDVNGGASFSYLEVTATPTDPGDVATKGYVDSIPAGEPTIIPRATGVRYRPVAGAIRKSGGVWSLINDAGHVPTGITSVTDGGTYLQIHYGFTASKVTSLTVTPDESYTLQGYTFGASVGLDQAAITIARNPIPAGGYVSYSGTSWTFAAGNITAVNVLSANRLNILHPEVLPATDLYISVSGRGAGKYLYRPGSSGPGRTEVEIYNLDGTPVTAWASDMRFYVSRAAGASGAVATASMPEGNTNIWINGLMEV